MDTSFKVKEFMNFVEQKYKFDKNETKLKMENPTHSFTERILMLKQLI